MQKLSELAKNLQNPRRISEKKREMLRKSVEQLGCLDGVVWNRRLARLIGGHQRQDLDADATVHVERQFDPPTPEGTVAEGFVMIKGIRFPYREVDWEEATDKAANIAANKGAGQWDYPTLKEWMHELDALNFDLELTMFDEEDRALLMTHESAGGSGGGGASGGGSMADKFLVPPFSILDARQGYWKQRKKQWLSMGIQSEVGRGENLLKYSPAMNKAQAGKKPYQNREHGEEYEGGDAWAAEGTSIFDPVLCELAYRWFCPPGGAILDPFAGGSVRGIVASRLGRQYVGIDLRAEQVEANRDQAHTLCSDPLPAWEAGDSKNIQTLAKGYEADFLFTCPPYADLEVYSDSPDDLSTMEYPAFRAAYEEIVLASCAMLKADRFAAIVVGDIRDQNGAYRNFVSHTIEAFEKAGLSLYNEAILVTSLGSLPLRAGRIFIAGRKLGKTHQNVLVFVKGDPKKATEACGEIEIADLAALFPEEAEAQPATETSKYGEEL